MEYEDLEKWKNNNSEIVDLTENISHLINTCLHNLNPQQTGVVQQNVGLLLKQQLFWLDNNNPERAVYDLREFGLWLCDYIADAEDKFWGNE